MGTGGIAWLATEETSAAAAVAVVVAVLVVEGKVVVSVAGKTDALAVAAAPVIVQGLYWCRTLNCSKAAIVCCTSCNGMYTICLASVAPRLVGSI